MRRRQPPWLRGRKERHADWTVQLIVLGFNHPEFHEIWSVRMGAGREQTDAAAQGGAARSSRAGPG
jgi:hypothetical protein